MFALRWFAQAAGLALLVATVGCSKSGPDLSSSAMVSGVVTQGGNPINGAKVTFISTAEVAGKKGEYAASAISRLEPGLHVPATHYLDAQRVRAPLLREFVAECFSQVDALVLPVMPTTTPTLEKTRFGGSGTQPRLVAQMTGLTRWVNYLGLPALSLPCGFDRDGLPVGVQIVGRPYSEALLVAIGAAYQRVTDFHLARPALH